MSSASEVHVAAAHDEAGHAVVAYLNGVRPQSITVYDDGPGSFNSDHINLTPQTETMIAIAGPAAEYLLRNPCGGDVPSFAETVESHGHLWSEMDRYDACKHSESLPAEEQCRFREQYWRKTWEMLCSHWSSVQAIAAAVVEKETINPLPKRITYLEILNAEKEKALGRLDTEIRALKEPKHSAILTLLYSNRYPGNPDPFIITEYHPKSGHLPLALAHCIVQDEDACWTSATDLLIAVDSTLEMLNRGGQPLTDGVPRPCRVCGVGQYVSEERFTMLSEHHPPLKAQVYSCWKCGHVQLFVPPKGPTAVRIKTPSL